MAKALDDRVRNYLRWHVQEPLDRSVFAPLRQARNASRQFRPIFVGGASGAGTSVMALSIAQRFDTAGVIYETNFQVGEDSFLSVPTVDSFDTPSAYQAYMTPVGDWSVEAGRADLQRCYRRHCSGGSDVVVDKGPDINLLRAAFLHRCFPESPFVLIFRDAASNVEGLRRKWRPFRDRPLTETIDFYAAIHQRFLEAAESFPGLVHAVHYETLVEQPDTVLSELGRRLGLRGAARKRRLHSSPNVEGRGIRNVRGSEIGYVTDATRRAHERLGPGELEEIRHALGPLEKRLREAPFTIAGDRETA